MTGYCNGTTWVNDIANDSSTGITTSYQPRRRLVKGFSEISIHGIQTLIDQRRAVINSGAFEEPSRPRRQRIADLTPTIGRRLNPVLYRFTSTWGNSCSETHFSCGAHSPACSKECTFHFHVYHHQRCQHREAMSLAELCYVAVSHLSSINNHNTTNFQCYLSSLAASIIQPERQAFFFKPSAQLAGPALLRMRGQRVGDQLTALRQLAESPPTIPDSS